MRIKSYIILIFILFCFFATKTQEHQFIDSLKSEIQNSNSDTITIKLLINLADQYSNVYQDSSILYLKQALDIAREINDFDNKALLMNSIGGNYCLKGEYLKSLEYLDLADNILKEYPDKRIQANIYYLKSIVFVSIDRFNQASEFAVQALDLYKSLDNTQQMGAVYTVLSNVYEELGNKRQSLEYAKMAYKAAIEVNDSIDISGKLNNLATLYFNNGNTDSAYLFLWQAISINKKYNVKTWLGINYQNLADYLLVEGKLDSATYYINKVIEICDETGYRLNYFPAIEVKAKIALASGDTVQAVGIYHSIVKSTNDLESLSSKVNAYEALLNIAKEQGRFQDAFGYQYQYKIFDDSLNNQKNTNLLSMLEMQMVYEKQHNQLELENQQVKLNSQRKNFYIILLIGGIFLVLIIALLIIRLQRAKAISIGLLKQKLEEELDYKNREMTANVMSLMKKNEILGEISKKLLEVEERAVKKETRVAIGKISDEIRKSQDVELWEEFDLRFRQIHQNFYDNLLQNAPQLSPNEQRMCAFLRMNMSTKDISELTGLDKKTVDNTRYKVRKKLKLEGKTNLITFLSKM